jgi:hypothetical protein
MAPKPADHIQSKEEHTTGLDISVIFPLWNTYSANVTQPTL